MHGKFYFTLCRRKSFGIAQPIAGAADSIHTKVICVLMLIRLAKCRKRATLCKENLFRATLCMETYSTLCRRKLLRKAQGLYTVYLFSNLCAHTNLYFTLCRRKLLLMHNTIRLNNHTSTANLLH